MATQRHIMEQLSNKGDSHYTCICYFGLEEAYHLRKLDRIMDPNSDFQKAFVEYLESVHIGEFMTGTMDDVKANVE